MSAPIDKAWEAARLDNLETLRELVPDQVDPNAKRIMDSNQCHSLFMAACAHGAVDCATYLLDQGADVNLKNFSGFTALHWAAFSGRIETIDLLKAHNADFEARTADGKTPLHVATFRGQRSFIQYLLSVGAYINSVDSNGWNALHYAVLSNQQATADFLIKKGIDFDQVDAEKKSLRDFASEHNAQWLLTMIDNMN